MKQPGMPRAVVLLLFGLAPFVCAQETGYYARFSSGSALITPIVAKSDVGIGLLGVVNQGPGRGVVTVVFPPARPEKAVASPGASVDITLGWHLCPNWALEFGAGATRNYLDLESHNMRFTEGISFDQIPLTTRVVYEFRNSSRFTPYAAAGPGLVIGKFGLTGVSSTDIAFAWQMGAGCDFRISDHVEVGLGYNYSQSISQRYDLFGGRIKLVKPAVHYMTISLNYQF